MTADHHDGRPRVALDTSGLMMPVECDVRVFDELDRLVGDVDLVAPSAVVAELDGLSAGAGEAATAAAVGRDLLERCRIVETDASNGDDALVELAARGDCEYVVTNDRPLRDRLLGLDVRVVGLRGTNILDITQP
jgi:rRNA-processing protein FCF1